jgi:hypothetical protein
VIGVRRPEWLRLLLLKPLAVDFENFDRSTGRSVIKDADCKPTSVPRKRIFMVALEADQPPAVTP